MAVVTHNGRVTVPDAKPKDQSAADVHDYVRELNDEELMVLAVDLARRGALLQNQGVVLDMATIENHHLLGLLETLVGRADAARVKEWQLTWVDRYLDSKEAQVRSALLTRMDDFGIPK